MRINPVPNYNLYSKTNVHSSKVQYPAQSSFKGWKGAGVGAGIGAVWAGAILAMTAVGAPYLLPLIATDVAIGGIGTGAIAGHCMQKELKGDDKKK